MTNPLITKANELLKSGGFEYAFCGGYAIELFLDKQIRRHGDVDVSAFWSDRDKIILYMQSIGWAVYEMCGGGKAHHITDISHQFKVKRNIFCFKEDCELIALKLTSEPDMYYMDFDHRGQNELDFIEFLFNDRNESRFLYARNSQVALPLEKAILYRDGLPYLSPVLVLLYKSTDTEREGYQLDFDAAILKMNAEQRKWLNTSLKAMFPDGHKWLQKAP